MGVPQEKIPLLSNGSHEVPESRKLRLQTDSYGNLAHSSNNTPRSPFETGFPTMFMSTIPSPRPQRRYFFYTKHDKCHELHVFLTLLMSVVGAGMLSVPYTFLVIPTWESFAGIVFVGISMACTANALLYAHVQLADEEESLLHIGASRRFMSFQSIAIAAGGNKLGYLVSIVTAIGIFGGCVGCIRIVRDIAPFIISLTYSVATSNASKLSLSVLARYGDYLLWAAFVLVVFPLCLLKNLSGLRISSYLGFIFSLYLIVAITYRSFFVLEVPTATEQPSATDSSSNVGVDEDHVLSTKITGALFSRFSQSISIYNYAFMMHLNLIPLFVQLRGTFAEPLHTSKKKMTLCIIGVSAVCVLLYSALGWFSMQLYGDTVRGNILLNLESDPMMDVPLVAVFLTVVLSFPLLFHPLRGVIEELAFTTTVNDIAFITRLGLTSGLLLSQLLIAIGVPGIEVVFALTGASSCLMICFVFPALLFTVLYPWKRIRGGQLWVGVLWLIVVFFTVTGITATYFIFTN